MKSSKKLTMLARLTAAVSAGLLAFSTASPAAAAEVDALSQPDDCGRGFACLYSGYNYGNNIFQNRHTLRFEYCIRDLREYNYDDITSSFFNAGRQQTAYIAQDLDFTGRRISFAIMTGSRDLGRSHGFNDEATSATFAGFLNNPQSWRCN